MQVIYKYRLGGSQRQPLAMPYGAEVLSVQMQGDEMCLWALVDSAAEPVVRTFQVLFTGSPFTFSHTERMRHLATVQRDIYVWHVFEIEREDIKHE